MKADGISSWIRFSTMKIGFPVPVRGHLRLHYPPRGEPGLELHPQTKLYTIHQTMNGYTLAIKISLAHGYITPLQHVTLPVPAGSL